MTREEKVKKLKEKILDEIKVFVQNIGTISGDDLYDEEGLYSIDSLFIVRSLYEYINKERAFMEVAKVFSDRVIYELNENLIDRFLHPSFNFTFNYVYVCIENPATVFNMSKCMNDKFINFNVMSVIESLIIDKKIKEESEITN